ncbi:MAG: AMP-binding protein [Chloroflexota bacterium]
MNDTLLRIYHGMPYPFRVAMASTWGYRLRWWRYTAETERLKEEALAREQWSTEQWKAWQEERLGQILHRAATQVPYYREIWSKRRQQGDKASWDYLENWPILEKDPLRNTPRAFVADDCDIKKMYHEHTSGTTGKSLDLWWSQEMVREWYALFEARWRHWYGVSRHDRWAILGGQLVVPTKKRQPPFWVWNAGLNQLYMSSYHLAPDLIHHYFEALQKYKIKYVLGYTSSLHELAETALRQGGDILAQARNLPLKVIITNAEPVFDYQRKAIEEAFQRPLKETYGMSEAVAAASECEHHHLHLWPEIGWIEVVNQDQPVPLGTSGDLVCTGLLNIDMPLIRYRIGDRGALPAEHTVCACGNQLPILASVEGRIDDVLYTADGRRIGRLDPIFKARLPVREAQIIQDSLQQVRVRYVPTAEFTAEAGQSIIKRLQDRMGDVTVTLEELEQIPRTNNGKFRAVVCNLPPEEKNLVQRHNQ